MNEDWGLTAEGFKRPTYLEILDALEYKARELFGRKANLTVRSPVGLFLHIFAWIWHLLFQLAEDVYNSRFADTAVGHSLYNTSRMIGLRLLPAAKASGDLEITGTPGTIVPAGFLVSTIAGIQYVVVAESTIAGNGKAKVPIQAMKAGPEGNTASNTIKEIVTPMPNIESVINTEPVDGGRDRETDEQHRDRYFQSVDISGGSNADAIRAEILQTVEGIISVKVYENYTDEVDEFGLPPHSIEAVCYGGLDTDIAKAIYRKRAGGIEPYGNIKIIIMSLSEPAIEICFSRPVPVSIWVRVKDLVTDDKFPHNGRELVQEAIIKFIGGDINKGLTIGETVYFYRLPEVINNIPGVIDYDIEISSDGKNYSKENIPIDTRQKSVTDEDKVVVL